MILVIVLLAKQDDVGGGGSRQNLVGGNALAGPAGDLHPARRRDAASGRCCRPGQQQRSGKGTSQRQQRPERHAAIPVAPHLRHRQRAPLRSRNRVARGCRRPVRSSGVRTGSRLRTTRPCRHESQGSNSSSDEQASASACGRTTCGGQRGDLANESSAPNAKTRSISSNIRMSALALIMAQPSPSVHTAPPRLRHAVPVPFADPQPPLAARPPGAIPVCYGSSAK